MRKRRLSLLKDFLWMLTIAGFAAGILRFAWGLGATSGLNDGSPWGLWIAFKLGFVALAGGGFTLAALVYIFHLDNYRPLVRRALLLALLGYGSFIVSLLFDLGLPWHIYMPVIHWQHHSVMFEIAWCVMLYFTVLVLEFTPVILEHPLFDRPVFRTIHFGLKRAVVPLVIAGIVLSTLHQSSLGGLFLIMPHRVHPLWYSPWIPVMFFISAIAAGMLALIVESRIAFSLFGRGLNNDLLQRLGKMAGFVLWIYLVIRVGDLLWRGVLPGALDMSWQAQLFGVEILIGGVLPAILLGIPQIRRRPAGLLSCAILGIGGVLSQRMALSLFTMARPSLSYFPSALEIVIALAIPAAAGLVYLFFFQELAVIEREDVGRIAPARPRFDPATYIPAPAGPMAVAAHRFAVAVFALALIVAVLPDGGTIKTEPAIVAHEAIGWERLIIDCDQDGIAVNFPHVEHQLLFGEEQQVSVRTQESTATSESVCLECHHINAIGDIGTSCIACHREVYRATSIFDHNAHVAALGGNQACAECHIGEHRASTAGECRTCHEDMVTESVGEEFNPLAAGYKEALHDRCLDCHQERAQEAEYAGVDDCRTCHNGVQESGSADEPSAWTGGAGGRPVFLGRP